MNPELYECPNCGSETAALALVRGGTGGYLVCPACSPTPGTEPHDYRPVMLASTALETVNLVSGVCCGDAGDCDHECGIA